MEREVVRASLAACATRGLIVFILPSLKFCVKKTQGKIAKAAGFAEVCSTGQALMAVHEVWAGLPRALLPAVAMSVCATR